MTKVDYKRIWQELKEERIEEYIMLQDYTRVLQSYIRRHPRIERSKSLLTKTEMILKRMDELDGTNEFHNLLHDLERANVNDLKQ
uniref:Terminase small subunit n=1 Tax=Staphylococcus phage Pel11 TaxID=3235046 RepID=A0AB39C806_9CAUD